MYSPSLLDTTVIPSTIYKSFEYASMSLSLIVTYYCVGFDCLNTKIEKHKYLAFLKQILIFPICTPQ